MRDKQERLRWLEKFRPNDPQIAKLRLHLGVGPQGAPAKGPIQPMPRGGQPEPQPGAEQPPAAQTQPTYNPQPGKPGNFVFPDGTPVPHLGQANAASDAAIAGLTPEQKRRLIFSLNQYATRPKG